MPPFKGMGHELSGDAAGALWGTGHGQRVAIVDSSYTIPASHRSYDLRTDLSSHGLEAVLEAIPNEGPIIVMHPDNEPGPDDKKDFVALDAFRSVARAEKISLAEVRRYGDPEIGTNVGADHTGLTVVKAAELLRMTEEDFRRQVALGAFATYTHEKAGERVMPKAVEERLAMHRVGFYALLRSDPETIVLQTGDSDTYACALLTVGHSQIGRLARRPRPSNPI